MIQPRSELVSKPRLNSKSSDTQYNDLSTKMSYDLTVGFNLGTIFQKHHYV